MNLKLKTSLVGTRNHTSWLRYVISPDGRNDKSLRIIRYEISILKRTTYSKDNTVLKISVLRSSEHLYF